jgi:hypothetical protein
MYLSRFKKQKEKKTEEQMHQGPGPARGAIAYGIERCYVVRAESLDSILSLLAPRLIPFEHLPFPIGQSNLVGPLGVFHISAVF